MTRPRRAPLSVAGLVAGTAAAVAPLGGPVAPVAADETEFCWLLTISEEEVELGVTTDVVCDDEPPAFRSSTVAYALHYYSNDGLGTNFTAYGEDDCSGRTNLSSGSPWNDAISSSRFATCTNVKHFTGQNFTGSSQLLTGSYGQVAALNGTLNDQSSSIGYGL